MTENNDAVNNDFFMWLSDKFGEEKTREYIELYKEIDENFIKNNLLHNSVLEINNDIVLSAVVDTLKKDFFHIGSGTAEMIKAIEEYRQYLKNPEKEKNENIGITCNAQIKDMGFKTLSRLESSRTMEEWINSKFKMPKVTAEYALLRKDIQDIYSKVKSESNGVKKKKGYFTDVKLGLYLYIYFNSMSEFNMRCAADDDFWRYLCVKVVPDIVGDRWGCDNEDHYWKKPTRIWLRSIWWYIHLSWQGSFRKTEKLLMNDCFDTDTILNLEERTGREGTFINVSRLIMKKFSEVADEKSRNFIKRRQESPFRIIMKLNTAKMVVMEPALCEGGEEGYVTSLFEDAGVI